MTDSMTMSDDVMMSEDIVKRLRQLPYRDPDIERAALSPSRGSGCGKVCV
jgi:hypothetical protein